MTASSRAKAATPVAPAETVIATAFGDLRVPRRGGVPVQIRRRVRLASPNSVEWEEEDGFWPEGWSLPEQGTIVLGRELSGWVDHTEFDIVNGRVNIILRPQ